MNRFEEDKLAFTFGAGWNETALKFDAPQGTYKKISNLIEGTKGVDFLGICSGELVLIEVKDFRKHRIENKKRVVSGELTTEIAQKVRDSIACVVGVGRTSDEAHWNQFARLLIDKQKGLRVVLWLEEDFPRFPQNSPNRKGVLLKELKRKLGWLTSEVVIHSLNYPLPGSFDLQVDSLPFTQ